MNPGYTNEPSKSNTLASPQLKFSASEFEPMNENLPFLIAKASASGSSGLAVYILVLIKTKSDSIQISSEEHPITKKIKVAKMKGILYIFIFLSFFLRPIN